MLIRRYAHLSEPFTTPHKPKRSHDYSVEDKLQLHHGKPRKTSTLMNTEYAFTKAVESNSEHLLPGEAAVIASIGCLIMDNTDGSYTVYDAQTGEDVYQHIPLGDLKEKLQDIVWFQSRTQQFAPRNYTQALPIV